MAEGQAGAGRQSRAASRDSWQHRDQQKPCALQPRCSSQNRHSRFDYWHTGWPELGGWTFGHYIRPGWQPCLKTPSVRETSGGVT